MPGIGLERDDRSACVRRIQLLLRRREATNTPGRIRTPNPRIRSPKPDQQTQALTEKGCAGVSISQSAGDLLALARALGKLSAEHRETILAKLPADEREAVAAMVKAAKETNP